MACLMFYTFAKINQHNQTTSNDLINALIKI